MKSISSTMADVQDFPHGGLEIHAPLDIGNKQWLVDNQISNICLRPAQWIRP